MHEKPEVIGVQPGESSLTSEVLHDDFRHGDIFIFKKSERKNSLHLISVLGFDIRLIVMLIEVLGLVPLLPNIWNPGEI